MVAEMQRWGKFDRSRARLAMRQVVPLSWLDGWSTWKTMASHTSFLTWWRKHMEAHGRLDWKAMRSCDWRGTFIKSQKLARSKTWRLSLIVLIEMFHSETRRVSVSRANIVFQQFWMDPSSKNQSNPKLNRPGKVHDHRGGLLLVSVVSVVSAGAIMTPGRQEVHEPTDWIGRTDGEKWRVWQMMGKKVLTGKIDDLKQWVRWLQWLEVVCFFLHYCASEVLVVHVL